MRKLLLKVSPENSICSAFKFNYFYGSSFITIRTFLLFVPIDIQKCASNPCANDGTCHPIGNSVFSCVCAAGFMGFTCEEGKIIYVRLSS